MTENALRHELGDKVYLVRDLESEGQPLLGEYLGTHEDVVRYLDAAGTMHWAPEDCVRIEPFAVTKVPNYDLPTFTVFYWWPSQRRWVEHRTYNNREDAHRKADEIQRAGWNARVLQERKP